MTVRIGTCAICAKSGGTMFVYGNGKHLCIECFDEIDRIWNRQLHEAVKVKNRKTPKRIAEVTD